MTLRRALHSPPRQPRYARPVTSRRLALVSESVEYNTVPFSLRTRDVHNALHKSGSPESAAVGGPKRTPGRRDPQPSADSQRTVHCPDKAGTGTRIGPVDRWKTLGAGGRRRTRCRDHRRTRGTGLPAEDNSSPLYRPLPPTPPCLEILTSN